MVCGREGAKVKEIRLFPRYDIRKLKSPIEIDYQIQEKWILKDIGLGGLQIRSNLPIQIKEEKKIIKIKLFAKEEIVLKITQMWSEERNGEHLAGFQIFFEEMSNYIRWRNILKALHLVLNKKKN